MIIVILINFVILALLGFPEMAIGVIYKYYILLILLIGGFGIQVGLFTYLNSMNAIGCSTTIASGGISTVSMILCCSHYLLNIIPFLGAFVGASFLFALSKYTLHFLLIGIASNVTGIGVLYYQVKRKSKWK